MLFAGAGAGALLHHVVRRKSKDETLSAFAAQVIREENLGLKHDNNMLSSYNAQHVKKIAELEKALHETRLHNEILQAMPFDLPLPMWSVDRNHSFDFINKMYADIFLSPRGMTGDECLGLNIFDIWPNDVAAEFHKNNLIVMDTGAIFNGVEHVPDPLGKVNEWRILKFKRKIPLGVIGIAIPKNGMFDEMLNKIK